MKKHIALFLALCTPAQADTLVDHVEGLTLDAGGQVERFTGMVITADGKVSRLLHRGDKRPERPDYLIDGKGSVLLPGMIDSHAQVMALGLSTLLLDLSPAKSAAEAQARLAAYAAAHPDRPWIIGLAWDVDGWGAPAIAQADAVATGRPVLLLDADGESGWANGAALIAAGLPAGKSSVPLQNAALAQVRKAVPQPRPEDRDLAFAAAQQGLLERGVTAVADMGTTITDWQTFRRAGDAGQLRIRIMAYAGSVDDMVLIGGPGPTPWLYDDKLRLNGLHLVLDGTLGARSAALKAPYADDAKASGAYRLSEAQLRNQMSRAAMDRFQLAISAQGDRAVTGALDAIAELAGTYGGDRRWRIEGLGVVDLADVPRFSRLGISASMQPLKISGRSGTIEARLGPDRLARVQPWNALAAAGTLLAFGTGTASMPSDPFAQMATAIIRQDAQGAPYGGWQPQERLTREAALAALTAGGARAGMAEGRFGRLAPGERADFLLADRDPLLASAGELRETRVKQVWIGGYMAWERP